MFYFELPGGAISKNGKVKLEPGMYSYNTEILDLVPTRIRYAARRIWRESNGRVEYVKHINMPTSILDRDFKVDIKEFTWLKLTAKVIR